MKLFDNASGQEIPAHDYDLLRMEAHDFDTDLYFRVCGGTGTYILISARPGHIAGALKITFYRAEGSWKVHLHTSGVASHPHWDIDQAITALGYPEPIHPAIEAVIRKHVAYREGQNPAHQYLDQLRVNTLDKDGARRELALISDSDPAVILGIITDTQPVVLPVLCGAIALFCQDAGLQGEEVNVLLRLVPSDHHKRLEMVIDSLETNRTVRNLDDELKKLFEGS